MKKEKITPLKWKKGLDRELRTAVSNFNKKVRNLQKESEKSYLPDEIDVKELRSRIVSREELNRVINSLRRFGKEGAEELIILESGQGITKWEKKKLENESKIAETRIKEEIAKLHKPTENGFSRAQMGSAELRKLESQLESVQGLEKKTGQSFNKLKQRLGVLGSYDLKLRQAIQYRKNYADTIEKQFKNFDGYEELKKAFDEHKDPFSFFRWMESTGNLNIIDISYESNNVFTQEEFYKFLDELNVKYNKNVEFVERGETNE